MSNCSQINMQDPNLVSDPCGGEKLSTDCVVQESAITALGLPPESTQTEVNIALTAALQAAVIRIQALESI